MMDGVEILSVVNYETSNILSIILLGILILGAGIIIVLTIVYIWDRGFDPSLVVCWVISIAFITGSIIGIVLTSKHFDDKVYKVTISEEVSLNEFLERYEILEQDGKIYTIKEKEK